MPPKSLPIYNGSVGLDTVHRPDDIPFDPDTGVTALAQAVNVKVEESGQGTFRVSRAYGFSQLAAGAYHSGWRDTGDAFVGKGTALYRFNPDETFTGVRSGLTGERIAFAQHGDDTYYSNGTQNGIISNATSRAWEQQTYLGPDNPEDFTGPPVCRHLAIRNSRVLLNDVRERNVLYLSEFGQLGLFSRGFNHWRLEDDVIMILDVAAGYFVSTLKRMYFVREVEPKRFKLEEKDAPPAIEWSEWPQKVNLTDLGIGEGKDMCRLWRGARGAIVGYPDGRMENMTEKMVKVNSGGNGASVYIPPYFIHSVEYNQ